MVRSHWVSARFANLVNSLRPAPEQVFVLFIVPSRLVPVTDRCQSEVLIWTSVFSCVSSLRSSLLALGSAICLSAKTINWAGI